MKLELIVGRKYTEAERLVHLAANTQRKECHDVEKLRSLVEEGERYSDIAKIFCVSRSLVCSWCKKYNITTRGVPHNKKQLPPKEELSDLYHKQGLSFVEIGRHYGVSNVTAKKWFVHYGLLKRTRSEDQSRATIKGMRTKELVYGDPMYGIASGRTNTSEGENELRNWMKDEFGYVFCSTREILQDRHELDLYNSDLRLAIEYAGEWYHSENPSVNNRGKKYHIGKYLQCKEQGIRLLTIFGETEWCRRKKQVKQYLRVVLGGMDTRVYARDCEVKKLDVVNRQFIEDNHIQGCPSTIQHMYGIFYNEKMIGAVSFSRHHRGYNILVLNRLCFLDGWQCIGGASKLIKNAIAKGGFDEVVTWSDNRWTEGDVYSRCGFRLDKEMGPDYGYTKGGVIQNKQSMKVPAGVKEKEHWQQFGYHRIWDCGKKKWVWNKNTP